MLGATQDRAHKFPKQKPIPVSQKMQRSLENTTSLFNHSNLP
jgi:hypothetical protein